MREVTSLLEIADQIRRAYPEACGGAPCKIIYSADAEFSCAEEYHVHKCIITEEVEDYASAKG